MSATGLGTTSDTPRDVYLAACADICSHFAERGFRFAKSGPHANKKIGEFRLQIGFQSSARNIAGVGIRMWISGKVFSTKLKEWRAKYSELEPLDYVAGCQLQNLTSSQIETDWDLADSITRPSTIQRAVSTIKMVALPYFEQFEDLESMIRKLQDFDVPAMPINRVIEFLMCFADPNAARNAGANFLVRHPEFVADYKRDFCRYAERGLQYRTPSSYSLQLAFSSHLFQLGDLTEASA